ncbi:hypothetical protein Patl1_02582 [Pistacia atlantica]|uniref:Uncharacterized protein n=1 Tax=Pistacia atlantica TaxID=434234 RepID=A0ACC1C9G6_9ROSI|nr:hypothetical protein Patl1_02582 [Pistacia atlantica]
MEESHGQGSSNTPAPFLTKTYEMVDDPITNSLVSWSLSGCSFIVWNPPDFSRDLLPKYFKHNNFSSFVRQLNTYGFRKIDPEVWEFANEEFIRGQKHLLKNIYRRKPVHSHSVQNQGNFSIPLTITERNEFERKIEKLKKEKSLLQLELQRYECENQGFAFQLQSLSERLKYLERRQMELMTLFANLLKKPGFASVLIQQSEVHNKRRRLLKPNYFGYESNMDKNWSLTDQKENQDAVSASISNLEQIEKLESSVNFWASFLLGINEAFSQDVYDFGVLPSVPAVIVSDEGTSSEDQDVYGQHCSPKSNLSSPHSMEIHSYEDHMDGRGPTISSMCLNVDEKPKPLGTDVILKPASASEAEALSKEVIESTNSSVKIGMNDMFWEQFLTDTPAASLNAQEIKSENGATEGGAIVSKGADHRNFWWNKNKLDNLTIRFGKLTSAGRT